ncbi:uncharacterized protein K452DRAFT_291075 [Aplosporella prunicola CBS 121167]|uniref:Uncharacterized protein n=1 Tax=Aplosporella prunicola CBS 121167 TaxID=1176127 RepID=A0A6A6B2I9_9PEZI|nr:uncharacterized protein K452DRAFT_291075 [Aplosporella prunicola CBS 121167]KAF2138036.1 hypothetical protein K452DRAFT_291075 [Aplosporella prunicola CBS 121167]
MYSTWWLRASLHALVVVILTQHAVPPHTEITTTQPVRPSTPSLPPLQSHYDLHPSLPSQ